jgi:uncharacterized protein YdcH (DUF465 family)
MDEKSAREYLLKNDPKFQELASRHREYEDKLATFAEKRILTSDEQIAEVQIKKEKLAAKDSMQEMILKLCR